MYILAIDQGTTSSRVVLYNQVFNIISVTQQTVTQIYPQNSWLEHNPVQIFNDIISLINSCIEICATKLKISEQKLKSQIISIGITNQRETSVLWDKTTGKIIHNAIVWQDRRTTDFCNNLKKNKLEPIIQEKTGLLIDPYFSSSKINWLLNNYNLRNNPNILFGTIDCYLIWRLTSGKCHATDITNASRTQLYNIKTLQWDQELLNLFDIPHYILPTVKNSADNFGTTDPKLFGAAIPITGVAGDQQAAAIGQLCIKPKQTKITYGTGCFVLQNTGQTKVTSSHKLITTIAYKVGNEFSYALEGSIFVAGAAVSWLKDAMGIINKVEDTEIISQNLLDTNGVYLVPAFTGLGAPYWDPEARGAIIGLTRDTDFKHIVRAALEAVVYQTQDLLLAFAQDYELPNSIKVDGGMSANNWFLKFLADITGITIEKPKDIESTVRGVALLSAIGAQIYTSLDNLPIKFEIDNKFLPKINQTLRNNLYNGWLDAVARVKNTK
jgi:glycerol kinase